MRQVDNPVVGAQEMAKTRGRKSLPWNEDALILERLAKVEPLYFERKTTRAIAELLDVGEVTVRRDIKRLHTLWLQRHGADQDERRAEVLAELNDIKARALAAAAFDEACERAVLFGEGTSVKRDAKGAAQFRGNKAASLNVARQAVMDQAKVLGLIVDKVAPVDGDGKPLTLAALIAIALQVVEHE